MPEIYVSIDVETDGKIPGVSSMLSLGAAALTREKQVVSTWYENLELLPGAEPHPSTLAFWAKNRDAYRATRINPKDPKVAMGDFGRWARSLPGKPVLVGYPDGWDFMWVYWYMTRFTGQDPFGFTCKGIKTMASLALNKPYREITTKVMPKRWWDPGEGQAKVRHTHNALDDAIEQGVLFCNIQEELERRLNATIDAL